jgi:hypothetical protein
MHRFERLSRPILALMLLSACQLVDQTTFDPALRARIHASKPATPATPVSFGQPALLTIRFDQSVDYEDALRQAVTEARRRKPDVRFIVVTVVPDTGSLDDQIAAVSKFGADARNVAAALQNDGVDQGQIGLGARTEPGLQGHEVRVYVE